MCVSCSAAAARNVSPAASSTVRPSRTCWFDSLPMVVVLPTPLTPTNIHTFGLSAGPGSNVSERSEPSSRETISASSSSSSICGSVISFAATLARNPSSSSVVTPIPTSARSSASSRSSKLSSVMPVRLRTPTNAPVNASRALLRRSRSEAGLTGSASTTSGSTTAGASSTSVSPDASGSLGGGAAGRARGAVGAAVRLALRRLTMTTPIPNTTTRTARIRKMTSIPIGGDATRQSARDCSCPGADDGVGNANLGNARRPASRTRPSHQMGTDEHGAGRW